MKREIDKYAFKAFYFPNKETDKSTQRRQLESLLDNISDKGLRIVTATAKEVKEVETEDE